MATSRRPPGPKGHFLIGNLPEFRKDWLAFFTMCAQEYGDIVSVRFGPRQMVLVFHPDAIEYVLATNNQNFRKPFFYRMNQLLFGNGLLTSEGEFWRRQRRMMQPAFHRTHIAAFADMIVGFTERLLAPWQDGQTRDIYQDMANLTLQNVTKALFDADIAGEEHRARTATSTALEAFNERITSLVPVPEWVPTPGNLRLRRAIRQLDNYMFGLIRQRRASGENSGDLLSILLHAQDEDGSRMTDKQLRDEVITFLQAGHDTTSVALAWTWYFLSLHPRVRAKLEAEIETVLDGRAPTAEDVPKLSYTEMVLKESMRLRPPAFAIGRQAIRDCEIGGYHIPAGTDVFMAQWVTHRDPRFFPDPEEFNPDRWANDLAGRLPKYAYFPFGGGQRMCIGEPFAKMQMILVVATIAQRYRLTLTPNQRLISEHTVTPQPTITLRPKDGIRMILHRRR